MKVFTRLTKKVKLRITVFALTISIILSIGYYMKNDNNLETSGVTSLSSVDFPDPNILKIGDLWVAYATGLSGVTNIQVAESQNLVDWTAPKELLPSRPSWQSKSMGLTWAPDVMKVGESWLLLYVARDTISDRQCLSYAWSSSPVGPFSDTSGSPFLCQSKLGGTIDPHLFQDTNGEYYLFFKNDGNAIGFDMKTLRRVDSKIWVSKISIKENSPPKLEAKIEWTGLVAKYAWQGDLVEAPSVIKNADSYFLFYSANNYDSANYGEGYAVSKSVMGPYEDQSISPLLRSNSGIAGPGGANVIPISDNKYLIAYHAFTEPKTNYANGGVRSLHLEKIVINRANIVTVEK
jgi:beta-xylosidase